MRVFGVATGLAILLLCNSCHSPGVMTGERTGPMVAPDVAEFATRWLEPGRRHRIKRLDIAYTDQEGRTGVLGDLMTKPVLITFFYTRCQNGAKCSMAVSKVASLQRALKAQGLDGQVRLLAISYEPQFDSPDRINRFGTDRGMAFGENAKVLRLDPARLGDLIDELEAPVNYNAGWVNTHGVQLILVDAGGRLVRKYHTVLWENGLVIEDVVRVVSGSSAIPSIFQSRSEPESGR